MQASGLSRKGSAGSRLYNLVIEVNAAVQSQFLQRNREDCRYKHYLASEVEKGLRSMIEVLSAGRVDINGEALLSDWEKIKQQYLSDNTAQSSRVQ